MVISVFLAIQHVRKCTGNQSTQCTQCYSSMYLYNINHTCLPCDVDGFYISQDLQCVQCDPACTTYTGSSNSSCNLACLPLNALSSLNSSGLQQITDQAIASIQTSANQSLTLQQLQDALDLINKVAQVSNDTDNATLLNVLQSLNSSLQIMQNLNTSLNLTNAIQQTANALSTVISKVAQGDCGLSTNDSIEALNTTYSLLGSMSDLVLENATTSDPPDVVNTTAFVSYSALVNSSQLSGLNITASNSSPQVQLGSVQNSQDLPSTVAVNYIYMKDNPLSCNGTPSTGFTLSFKDPSTDNTISVDTSVQVTYPAAFFPNKISCANGCTASTDSNGNPQCLCTSISIFDLKNQLASIYQQSNFNSITIANFLMLFKNPIYENWSLWVVVGYSIWLIITVISTKTCNKDYGLLKRIKEQKLKERNPKKLGRCYKLYIFFCSSHPLLSIYMFSSPDMSKSMKALLYYVREVGLLLCMTALFVPNQTVISLLLTTHLFLIIIII